MPTVSMVGLLAAAKVDEELVAALRVLTTEPVDLTSVDGFLAAAISLARDVRERLLDTLDLFGIAHGVLALRQGAEAAALPAVLRRLSQVDRVVARLAAVGAEARYRRLRAALASCARWRRNPATTALAEFLSGDDAVLAVMAAAVDVVEAAGPDGRRRRRPAAAICGAPCTGAGTAGDRQAPPPALRSRHRRGSLRLLGRNAVTDVDHAATRSVRSTPWWRGSIPD